MSENVVWYRLLDHTGNFFEGTRDGIVSISHNSMLVYFIEDVYKKFSDILEGICPQHLCAYASLDDFQNRREPLSEAMTIGALGTNQEKT